MGKKKNKKKNRQSHTSTFTSTNIFDKKVVISRTAFGKMITAERTTMQLSQAELAKKCRVNTSKISALEHGEPCDLKLAKKLAEHLYMFGVSEREFYVKCLATTDFGRQVLEAFEDELDTQEFFQTDKQKLSESYFPSHTSDSSKLFAEAGPTNGGESKVAVQQTTEDKPKEDTVFSAMEAAPAPAEPVTVPPTASPAEISASVFMQQSLPEALATDSASLAEATCHC